MKILYSFFFIATFFTVFGLNATLAKTNSHPIFDLKVTQRKNVSDDIQELLNQANKLYKQKKYDEALEVLKKAGELKPNDFRPKAMTGLVYLVQFKVKEASEEFANAIALSPNNKFLYLYKAEADKLQNKHEDALAASRKAIEIDPEFVGAYMMIGDILSFDKERRIEAFEAYRTAIKLDPKLLPAMVSLGSALVYSKKEKEAEENFRKTMALDPQKMAGRFELGRLLVTQGRLKEARKLWEERTTDKENVLPNFITVLERAEKLKKAKNELAKRPNDLESLMQMGFAVMDGDHWVVDGRQKEAIVHFRKALEIKPDFAEAQFAIVKAYIQIADTFEKENANLDKELIVLKKLDAKLAKEAKEYRKTYSGGFSSAPPPSPKN